MPTVRERKLADDSVEPRETQENLSTEQAAKASLQRTGYAPLDRIRCEFNDGTLTLRGSLPSYYMKQVAIVAVSKVGGIEVIDDQLDVS